MVESLRFGHISVGCEDIKIIYSPKPRPSIDTIVLYQIQLKSANDKAGWSLQHPISMDLERCMLICDILPHVWSMIWRGSQTLMKKK